MKLRFLFYILTLISTWITIQGQTIADAKQLFSEGKFAEALPVLKSEYALNPESAELNELLGISAYKTGNIALAEKCLAFASQKRQAEASLYLGELYARMYQFSDAEKEFAKYERAKRRDKNALSVLEEKRRYADQLKKLIRRTENIQIIDSLVVPKPDFLQAYHLSASAGSLMPVNDFFKNLSAGSLPLFLNERKDKVYFPQRDSLKGWDIYSMEKLLDNFGNQKLLPDNINDKGDQAYPFVMADGLTTYFASSGHNSMGGYDLYITRYNLASDSYLNPNQLNMPFNSPFNDYMLAVDEEKGVGWFATDRFQPVDSVCVYTFIPNPRVTLVDSADENYMTGRARIASLRDTWQPGVDYTALIATAKQNTVPTIADAKQGDFAFVIDDARTYHRLGDFRNPSARELYAKVINLQKELNRNQEELAARREQYRQSGADARSNLSASILSLERAVEALYREIQQLTVQSRNQEIRNTFN